MKPVIALNPALKQTQTILYVLATLGLILSLAKILLFGWNEMIAFIVLFCGAYSLNFCLIVFHVIFLIFSSFIPCTTYAAIRIQD